MTQLYVSAAYSEASQICIGAILYLVAVFGTIGNICLIVALRKNKRLRNASNLLTISLAASDLLIASVAMPISGFAAVNIRSTDTVNDTARYNYTPECTHEDNTIRISSFLCALNGFMIYVSSKISTWTLSVMAVERYIAVLYPLNYNRIINKQRMVLVIVTIWTMSIAVELPQAVFGWFPFVYYHNAFGCLSPSYHHMQYKYIHFTIFSICKKVFLNLLPTPLIGFCYHRILSVSFKNKTFDMSLNKRFKKKAEGKKIEKEPPERKRRLTTHASITQMLTKTQQKYNSYKKSFIWLIIIISYVICWSPVSALGISLNFLDAYCEQYYFRGLIITTFVVAIFNCCLNPVIYGFLHQQIRRTFLDMICCRNTQARLRLEQQQEYLGQDTVVLSRAISAAYPIGELAKVSEDLTSEYSVTRTTSEYCLTPTLIKMSASNRTTSPLRTKYNQQNGDTYSNSAASDENSTRKLVKSPKSRSESRPSRNKVRHKSPSINRNSNNHSISDHTSSNGDCDPKGPGLISNSSVVSIVVSDQSDTQSANSNENKNIDEN